MQQVVVVLSHLTLHLHHVRPALLAQFVQSARLCQQSLRVGKLSVGKFYRLDGIHGVDKLLHHVYGLVVLSLLQRRGSRILGYAGLAERVPCVPPVNHRQRRTYLIAVVECSNIVICVGLRVDVSSPVVLSAHLGRDAWQEVEQRGAVFRQGLFLLYALASHFGSMLNGITDAAVERPFLLCAGSPRGGKCESNYGNFHIHTPLSLPKSCQNTYVAVYQVDTANPRFCECPKIRHWRIKIRQQARLRLENGFMQAVLLLLAVPRAVWLCV